MKKISQNTWIKIALSILGILDALFVYLPNYAAVDQGLKGRCAIFFYYCCSLTLVTNGVEK